MNKTSMTLALALVSATLLATAPAQAAPTYGVYAGAQAGQHHGGEGQVAAASATLPGHAYIDASATANLREGSLGATSQSAPCLPCGDLTTAMATTRFWDTVTFHNGPTAGNAQLRVSIDGTLRSRDAIASARFYVGAAHEDFWQRLDSYAPAVDLATGLTKLSQDLALLAGDTTVLVFADLVVDTVAWPEAGAPASRADFGHGLRFSWTLPEGVATSSASGQFMTATATLPEPASLALLGSGLGLLGIFQRRRRIAT